MNVVDNKLFKERSERMYDVFLNSPLVCFNPFEQNDEEVLKEIKRRSLYSFKTNYLAESETFCAVFNVIGSQNMSDYGYSGEQFVLSPIGDMSDTQRMFVKESCFKYDINVDTGFDFKFIDSSNSNRFSEIRKISTINEMKKVRFCKDVSYLLGYYIPGRDRFETHRKAYRFYRVPILSEQPDFFRRHFIITRAFVLNYIMKYPKVSPPAFGPDYILTNNHMSLLEEIFMKKYKHIFEDVLNETLEIMDKKHIPHPETI